ncbi:MAG: NAD-dependent epimerase/dehydratase family protein [Desulfobacterales bacterium]
MGQSTTTTGDTTRSVLVTGGGGFLGSAIVDRLSRRGDRVFSFARSFYPELTGKVAGQIQGDICNPDQVLAACKNMDVVFHVAAKPGVWGRYSDYYQTNVVGTQNVIDACRTHQVPYLVHTSSPSVIFDGTDVEGVDESAPYSHHFHSPYQRTKAIAERAVIAASDSQLKTIVLRPHLIWGPGDNHLVPRVIARAKTLFIVGDGNNLVDTTYIDNAADAHVLAADRLAQRPELSGRIYFISQGEPVRLWDMINNILRAGGLDPVTRSMPRKVARFIGGCLELIYTILQIKQEPKMTRFVADELSRSHWFDIGAAKKDLGYIPEVTMDEGLARLEAWLRTDKNPSSHELPQAGSHDD